MADLLWITVVPVVTVFLMVVAFVMTVVSQSINRVVISHFLGWNRYHEIRREVSAFNKERMAATRANDQKLLEKLKKKESQINALNAKMMKPQMITMVMSFFTLIPWFLMRNYFVNIPVAYLPGFENGLSLPLFGLAIAPGGGLFLLAWYLPVSFFVSTLMQRVLGTMPIE
ncbi:MAG: EMC3/TMCO1 family protein [Nitrososphaerota archaeon]|jgi:uncharacterized membrane protein (DUF106 family)|nr:EMC3/TMCO1 family protein [Nitrososphaerota archaeon]